MQYQVNRGERGKVEIKVDLAKSEFMTAYNRILSEYTKDAKIAGFRPGKAPAGVVEQHIGLSKILNETASSLISKNLAEIFKKEDLTPVDSPKIAIESLSRDAPFSFVASFSQKPKVAIGDWKKIKVKKVKARAITEEDITESIKSIFEAWVKNKSKVSPDGRAGASQKPKVEETEGETDAKKFIYDAHGNKLFFEKSLRSSPPEADAGLKINDEFAKAIGAKDLSHLREIVKNDLETVVANQVEAKLEEEIFEQISETGTVEVPDVLVEDELNRILVRLSSQVERQGKKLDDYLSEQKTTIAELKNKWRDQAAKNVKITLLLDEIGKQEKVTVKKEEVELALKNVSETNLSADQRADLERYMAVSIFQAKTMDLVKKTASS